jgi:hypothetical protein
MVWPGAVQQRRPRARTWLLAAVELAAAILVARLIGLTAPTPSSTRAGDHGMSGMPDMAAAPTAHWGWMEYTAIGVAAAALAWWLLLRQPLAWCRRSERWHAAHSPHTYSAACCAESAGFAEGRPRARTQRSSRRRRLARDPEPQKSPSTERL